MRYLSGEIGPRFAGHEGEHSAAAYLADQFRAYESIEKSQLQRVNYIGWRQLNQPSLTVTAPFSETIPAASLIYSAPTQPGGIRGQLAHLGNRVLIAGLYEFPTYGILDSEGNAIGELIVNVSGGAIPILNPDPIMQVPSVVIGQDTDARFKALLAEGSQIEVEMHTSSEVVPDAYSFNVVASYRGNPSSNKKIVVGAHYDTQIDSPGCYDNASGVAGMFGILEGLEAVKAPVNVDFMAFAGEEIGMVGSRYLVAELARRGHLEDIVAAVCLDQISGGDDFWLWADEGALRDSAVLQIEKANVTDIAREFLIDPNKPGADNWAFHAAGVPSCLLMWWRPAQYHRPDDTIDKIEIEKVEWTVELAISLILNDLATW